MDTVSYLLGKKNGGGSGTTNYNDLSNKPSINDVTLSGNKTSSDLGVQSEINSNNKLSADLVDDSLSANKFVSASDKTTWSGKQDTLVSGTNIKTINNQSILGSGDITISGGGDGDTITIWGDKDTTQYSTITIDPTTLKKGVYRTVFPNLNVSFKLPSEAYASMSEYLVGDMIIFKDYTSAENNEIIGIYACNDQYSTPRLNYRFIKKISTGCTYATTAADLPGYGVYIYPSSYIDSTIRSQWNFSKIPTTSQTPSADNQFATKKYVDDKPTTYAGYDATKTQVLKNINGTLTWITEE